MSGRAEALPSFAVQTGQPCAACHVGAFGPQLTPAGRAFKLFGYVASDGENHGPPIAVTSVSSFTRNNTPVAPSQGFRSNNNLVEDAVLVGYSGKIVDGIGAYSGIYYNGISNRLSWDFLDVRHAAEAELFGQDVVYGITVNNVPAVQDLWNSNPIWGFPYWGPDFRLSAQPSASTLFDFKLSETLLGGGLYAMWNNLLYVEADAYKGLGIGLLRPLGMPGTPAGIDGLAPYWRVALQHDADRYNWEAGTYGLLTRLYPGNNRSIGNSDKYTDVAVDGNFQWFFHPGITRGDAISAHVVYTMENETLYSSEQLFGTNHEDHLNSLKANVSYAIDASFIPTLGYFRTQGSEDEAFWYGGVGNNGGVGSPNSTGLVAELAYVPLGKPGSLISWGNAKLMLQYTAYSRFNGIIDHASDHNFLYVNLMISFAPFH